MSVLDVLTIVVAFVCGIWVNRVAYRQGYARGYQRGSFNGRLRVLGDWAASIKEHAGRSVYRD